MYIKFQTASQHPARYRAAAVSSKLHPVHLLFAVLLLSLATGLGSAQTQASAPVEKSPATQAKSPVLSPGVPFSADQLAELLPATVYFQGRKAPLQVRNAGGTTLAGGGILWMALVDTSGYASSVQEKYQFYLVSEAPLIIGGERLPAGAYGGGFVGERFVLMDVGGHDVAEGATERDQAFARPRPLQLLPGSPNTVKLYLGRRWVSLQSTR